jgi:fused signal recognition particle receptor
MAKVDLFGEKLKSVLGKTSEVIFGNALTDKTEAQPRLIKIDADFVRKLKNSLTAADINGSTADKILHPIKEKYFNSSLSLADIRRIIYREVREILRNFANPIDIDYQLRPQTVLVCGVNGAGKTTTVGKMAYMLSSYGWGVTVGACDIARDSATEQLAQLVNSSNVEIVAKAANNEPTSSIARRAYKIANENKSDLLLIDTAGRLQNKSDLMSELKDIITSLREVNPLVPHNVVLIIDATNGQSIKKQIAAFKEIANVTGIVVTKLDMSNKAGIIVSLVDEFRIPVHGIGIGSGLQDLQDFSADEFAASIAGIMI